MVFLGLTKSWFGWFGGIQPIPFNQAEALPRTSCRPAERSACSSCCAASRRARSRSPVSRRSPTACPRSAGPSRRTRRPRSRGWRRSSARCSSACRSSRTTCSRIRARRSRCSPQMGKQVFGNNVVFWVLQLATAGILTLAANTAYADFPRLSSIIARDGYLPRQLANRGDRLVFSNGVLVLAGVAGAADRRVRRQDQRADPALRGRRVHLVHAVAGGHGAAPPDGARAALEARRRDQRRRLVRDRDRRRSSSRSRSSPKGAWIPLVVIPVIVVLFKAIKQSLRERRRRAAGAGRLQAAPHEPHRRRARRQRAPRRARGARVREVAAPRPPARGDGRLRRGGAGADRAAVGERRHRRAARDRALAVPRAHAARSCASSTSSTPATRTAS